MRIREFIRTLQYLVVIAAVRLHLRCFGFRRSVAVVGRLTRRAGADRYDVGAATRTAARVARVAAAFPGRARCLEQSLTLYLLLRWARMPATFHLGVQTLPFTAHAWVELSGVPVNVAPELLATLQPFPPLLT